jgi:hypothetical protein
MTAMLFMELEVDHSRLYDALTCEEVDQIKQMDHVKVGPFYAELWQMFLRLVGVNPSAQELLWSELDPIIKNTDGNFVHLRCCRNK